jgi:hypothetical protein
LTGQPALIIHQSPTENPNRNDRFRPYRLLQRSRLNEDPQDAWTEWMGRPRGGARGVRGFGRGTRGGRLRRRRQVRHHRGAHGGAAALFRPRRRDGAALSRGGRQAGQAVARAADRRRQICAPCLVAAARGQARQPAPARRDPRRRAEQPHGRGGADAFRRRTPSTAPTAPARSEPMRATAASGCTTTTSPTCSRACASARR